MKITDPQDELLIVVDRNDKVIGKATRGECHKKMLRHRTAGAFIFDKNWNIFIMQRSETKDMEPLSWTLTSGGHVEFGSTYEETIKRELEEELKITGKPIFIKNSINDVEEELELSAQYYVVTDQQPKINREEIKQGRFMSFEELKEFFKKEKFTAMDVKYLYPILVEFLKDK